LRSRWCESGIKRGTAAVTILLSTLVVASSVSS
jgi:hypothetical protein